MFYRNITKALSLLVCMSYITPLQADVREGVVFLESKITKVSSNLGESDTYSETGSGFLVNSDGYIVTALHVVYGREVEKENFDENTSASVTGYFGPDSNRKVYDLELVYKDVVNDVAILKIIGGQVSHKPLCIGKSVSFNDYANKAINVAGYENGNNYSVVPGTVTDQRKGLWVASIPPAKGGMSGGPVFNPESEEVIGVYLQKRTDTENVREFAPISLVLDYFSKQGVEIEHAYCASYACNRWQAAAGRKDLGERKLSGASGRYLGAWYELAVNKAPSDCHINIKFQGWCKSNNTFVGAQGIFRLYLGGVLKKQVSCDVGPDSRKNSLVDSYDLTNDEVKRYLPEHIDLTRDYK